MRDKVVRSGLQFTRLVRAEVVRQKLPLWYFLERVGYSRNMFGIWAGRKNGPNIPGAVAMLDELGYELRIVKKEEPSGAPDFAKEILKEFNNEKV